jgi:SEC-C motif domain protein
MAVCVCASGRAYAACCGRWHADEAAPSAEALMRSRYAAFVLLDQAYLLATWHRTTRPASVDFQSGLKWLGLDVIDRCETGVDAAEVEFIARYRIGGGTAARLHERSRFIREDGAWFYVDGTMREKQSGRELAR